MAFANGLLIAMETRRGGVGWVGASVYISKATSHKE